MNIEDFVEFLKLSGRKTIRSESGYWYDAGGGVYLSIPHHETRNPTAEELQELFRKHRILGVKYSANPGTRGKPGGVYILRDRSYNLLSLPRKTRAAVRQGLKNCSVREIGFDYLNEHGMPLNLDTLKRQGRDDPLFSQPDRWEQFCNAGRQVEGASAWGAFVDDQLAAYLMAFIVNECFWILHSTCRTELMPLHPNHALQYTVIQEMISKPEIELICGGNVAILDLQGLRSFKMRMGYEIMPVSLVVIFHPVLKALLLGRLGEGLLGCMSHLAGNSDKLKRIAAIVDMAKQSR